MMKPRLGFSVVRVSLIAGQTLREAMRQKLFASFIIIAAAFAGGAWFLRTLNFGLPVEKFLMDVGFGIMTVFGSMLTIVGTTHLFYSELEHRTIHMVLSKPVMRSEVLLGKLLGMCALGFSFCTALTGPIACLLYVESGHVHAAQVIVPGLLQGLKFGVLAALTIFIASFSRTQLFTFVTGVAVLIICHLQPLARELYSHSRVGFLGRAVLRLSECLCPDFGVFDPVEIMAAPVWPRALWLSLYAGAYIAFYFLLAASVFNRREL